MGRACQKKNVMAFLATLESILRSHGTNVSTGQALPTAYGNQLGFHSKFPADEQSEKYVVMAPPANGTSLSPFWHSSTMFEMDT